MRKISFESLKEFGLPTEQECFLVCFAHAFTIDDKYSMDKAEQYFRELYTLPEKEKTEALTGYEFARYEERMEPFLKVIIPENFGWEGIFRPDNAGQNPLFSYLNRGDTYTLTIIHLYYDIGPYKKGYYVASYGDVIEELELYGEKFD